MTSASPRPLPEKADGHARRMELLISGLLRTGVIVSLALVVTGTILTFIHHPDYASSPEELQQLISGGTNFPFTWSDIAAGVLTLEGQAIVMVGLLLLIATPILRVAVSALIFIYQKDRVYTFITLIVLSMLLLSFVLGKVE